MQYDWKNVSAAAVGQWQEILKAYGIPFRPKQKAGPCPLCGGHDRAHFKEKDGKILLYCRHCDTHWGDELLLELAFGGDFNRMCNELGEWLHVRPEEAKTQAKIAAATDADSLLLASRIQKAKTVLGQTKLVDTNKYGIEFKAFQLMDGIAIPLKINGKLCDWIYILDDYQEVIEGEPVPGAVATLAGSDQSKKPVLTARFMDAVWLHQAWRGRVTVLCCGTLKSLQHIGEQSRDSYIIAIPNTIDAMDAVQTVPNDCVMPDDHDRHFCEEGYKFKPSRIILRSDITKMFYERIDNEHT